MKAKSSKVVKTYARPKSEVCVPEKSESLTFDLSDPAKAWRVELAQELIGLGYTDIAIKRRIAEGRPEQKKDGKVVMAAVEPCTYKTAIKHFDLAYVLLSKHLERSRTQVMDEAHARLKTLYRSAITSGDHNAAAQALDRLALIESTPNPVTAARTINTPPGHSPENIASLSDYALETLLKSKGIDPARL